MNNPKIFQLLIDHSALYGENGVRVDEVYNSGKNSFLTKAAINGYTELFEQILTILLNKSLKVDFYNLLIDATTYNEHTENTEIVLKILKILICNDLKILICNYSNNTNEKIKDALKKEIYRNQLYKRLTSNINSKLILLHLKSSLYRNPILDETKFNKYYELLKKKLESSKTTSSIYETKSQTTSSIYEKKFGNKEFNKTDNLISSLKIRDIKNCKELIANGTDLNIQDNDGKTALMYAAEFSNEIFELLIEKGADLNLKDNDGKTILMIVLDKLHPVEKTKLLIDKGADLNLQDNNGNTCLIQAITRENYEICKLLIESSRCDITIKNKYGKTAMSYHWFIKEVYHLVH